MQQAVLFKIKEGKKEEWHVWCLQIATSLKEEALLSLEEEKVLEELTLGFSLDGTDYILGYMEGECLPANMDREINKKHLLMKNECLERVGKADILYALSLKDKTI